MPAPTVARAAHLHVAKSLRDLSHVRERSLAGAGRTPLPSGLRVSH